MCIQWDVRCPTFGRATPLEMDLSTVIAIGKKHIGGGSPCFVIAEAGVNHNGNPALAIKLIEAAADVGADAVKFQTFDPELLTASGTPKAEYQKATAAANESQLDMLRALALPAAAWAELKACAESHGLVFLSTPFDQPSAQLLVELGMAAIKVPSGEITNLPFLATLAEFGKPLLVSTGMANLSEVATAVEAIERHAAPFCLLHCVSSYPADPADANLRAMKTLEATFGVPIGYSDHCSTSVVALAAAALGATTIEKHFTLDRSLPGPDQRMSTEPAEFARLVQDIRMIELALGDGRKRPRPSEGEVALVARKSLVAARAIQRGQTIKSEDVGARRTGGTGLSPALALHLVGRKSRREIAVGEVLDFSDVSKD